MLVCESSEEAPGSCPITPSMKLDGTIALQFTKKLIQFTQDFVSFNPSNNPEKQAKQTVMPILWISLIYSGEVELPKIPLVVERD